MESVIACNVVLALGGWMGPAVEKWFSVSLDLRVEKIHVCCKYKSRFVLVLVTFVGSIHRPLVEKLIRLACTS